MIRRAASALALIAAASLAAPAGALTTNQLISVSGGWKVFATHATSGTRYCAANSFNGDRQSLRVVMKTDGDITVTIVDREWRDRVEARRGRLSPAQANPVVTLSIDGTLCARGKLGAEGLRVKGHEYQADAAFWAALTNGTAIRISENGRHLQPWALHGSRQAFTALVNCALL